MTLWEYLWKRREAKMAESRSAIRTSGLANPEPWLEDMLGSGVETSSGTTVTEDSALSVTTVYRCVALIAGAIASLPLHLYRRDGDARSKDTQHSLYPLIHAMPNEEMTAFQWRETMLVHLLLWGNAYAYIDVGRDGRVAGLWPLTPDRISVSRDRDSRELLYTITSETAQPITLSQWQLLHIPGLGFDGIVGKSPIAVCREAVGLASATEEFGATYFGRGLHPGVAFEHPGVGAQALNDESVRAIKKAYREMHSKTAGGVWHDVMVLREGMKVNRYGIPPEDAQFLETRKFQVAEICRIYGVPPHMVGDVERSTSWGAGIEAQGIGFVVYVLGSWLRRIEQGLNNRLFSERETAAGYYFEHDVNGLQRGDYGSRMSGYNTARQGGWMSVNEIRALENMNPIDGGDTYLEPVNMRPVGDAAQQGDDAGDVDPQRALPLLEATWARVFRRGKQDFPVAVKRGEVKAWGDAFTGYAEEQLAPAALAVSTLGEERRWLDRAKPLTTTDPDTWDVDRMARQAARLCLGV